MKPPLARDDSSRFSGKLRHYHRSNTQPNRSWDEWIDGAKTGGGRSPQWIRIIGVLVAVLALGGIIAGLIIELR